MENNNHNQLDSLLSGIGTWGDDMFFAHLHHYANTYGLAIEEAVRLLAEWAMQVDGETSHREECGGFEPLDKLVGVYKGIHRWG